jgi:ketosteroid isomerase-like protein
MNQPPRRGSWTLIAVLCLLLIGYVFLRMYLPDFKSYARADTAASVRKVLDDQVAAWNRKDLEGFMQGYWNSPDLRFYSGKDVTSGWQATLERYRKRYQSEGREMGKLTFKNVEVKGFTPENAWARGEWQVVTSKETLSGLFTLIFQRFPEGWRIVHDHTSTAPPAVAVKEKSP